MSHTQIDFPFCAVQGQTSFKKALILAAINPSIGGVLVTGPRGSAKSTLARALASLLPPVDNAPSPFVSLPLATSLEMLTGTLDIEQILNDKELKFSPGLLSKANGGILYVDEVNLLPDHLVDQLLDVAASGVNRIERDGVSHVHDSVFSLIGTMNPDEGELRSQLKDRFGLMVQLEAQVSLKDRVEIVRLREAFDGSPQQFIEQHQAQQQQLANQITVARAHLTQVTCDEHLRMDIAQRCFDAGVDGLRADLVMYRAAIAHCAWRGGAQVDTIDIDAVEELVLAHRRTLVRNTQDQGKDQDNDHTGNGGKSDSDASHRPSEPPKPNNSPRGNGGFSRPSNQANPFSQPPPSSSKPSSNTDSEESQSGDWGQMHSPQKTTSSAEAFSTIGHELEQLLDANTQAQTAALKHVLSANKTTGKQNPSSINGQLNSVEEGSVNWFATVQRSFKNWPVLSFAYHEKKRVSNRLHLILLDTSASTLTEQLSSRAKACVLEISKGAYLKREQIQILGFGNQAIAQVLAKIKAPKELGHVLNSVDVAGGTPLREVLQEAKKILAPLLSQGIRQGGISDVRCYLITDGRSRSQVSDLSLAVPTVLIDTENSSVKRGRGALIAEQLKAQYLPLAQLSGLSNKVTPAFGALS